jgi:hypothetical protein
MNMRFTAGALVIASATFLLTRAVYSGDDTSDTGGKAAKDAKIERMKERAATVEEHTKLAALAGTWDADVVCTADGKERKSKATMTSAPELGGRVLLSRFKGDMDGQPFEGIELRGYDKEKREFWTVWCDSMGTSCLTMRGTRDADGNVTMKSDEFDCDGKPCVATTTERVLDGDHVTFDMKSTSAGSESQSMSIRYARRK